MLVSWEGCYRQVATDLGTARGRGRAEALAAGTGAAEIHRSAGSAPAIQEPGPSSSRGQSWRAEADTTGHTRPAAVRGEDRSSQARRAVTIALAGIRPAGGGDLDAGRGVRDLEAQAALSRACVCRGPPGSKMCQPVPKDGN